MVKSFITRRLDEECDICGFSGLCLLVGPQTKDKWDCLCDMISDVMITALQAAGNNSLITVTAPC